MNYEEERLAKQYYSKGWGYEHGIGVSIDKNFAVVWYEKAAALGYELAIKRLRDISNYATNFGNLQKVGNTQLNYKQGKQNSIAESEIPKANDSKNNSSIILDSFKKILSKTQERIDFSTDVLYWIENRKEDWDNDKIRVGVIGVTSSGKSTVINSILGADILSSAVTPSTGQLVSCTFGNTLQAKIFFENGKQKVFAGAELRPDNLKKYTDETYNLRNREKVIKIELTSPHFALDKDVMLVDSPGLDAYGLESHEKLTLESLVPTIDACVYVVTMKASSDQKTKEVLDVINRYNCPIIIVQNKLDSVLPSIDGKKTKAQVAEEHRRRVKRIVDISEIKNKNSVSIIQMSAKDAKDGREKVLNNQKLPPSFKYSNYDSFIKTVNTILETKRPEIEYTRKNTVLNKIREFIERINEITTPTQSVPKDFPLKELKRQINTHVVTANRKYETALKNFGRKALEVFDLIGIEGDNEVRTRLNEIVHDNFRPNKDKKSYLNDLTSRLFNTLGLKNNKTNFDKAIADINKAVDDFVKVLNSIEKDYFVFIEQNAEKVHIPSRDLKKSLSLHNHDGKLFKKEKTVQRTKRVEQSGGWGKFKRFVDIFVIKEGGKEQYFCSRVIFKHLLGCFKSVHPIHPDIHDDNINTVLFHVFNGVCAR